MNIHSTISRTLKDKELTIKKNNVTYTFICGDVDISYSPDGETLWELSDIDGNHVVDIGGYTDIEITTIKE